MNNPDPAEDPDDLAEMLAELVDANEAAAMLREYRVVTTPKRDDCPAMVALLCEQSHDDDRGAVLQISVHPDNRGEPDTAEFLGGAVSQRHLDLGRLVEDALSHQREEHHWAVPRWPHR